MNTTFASMENKRWMIVDDNANVLRMLRAMIQNLTDAKVEVFSSTAEALTAFAAAPSEYELILTDFEMPGMNGLEFCHEVTGISHAQKIFLMTGSGFFTVAAARRAGFSALLNKPFSATALLTALAEAGLEIEPACAA